MIGADHAGLTAQIRELTPEYMVMGERGMADMTEMAMAIPENTVPMMTGDGPFGSVEMGGMFSVLKVRKDQPAHSNVNPGWFKHPPHTVAYEYDGETPPFKRSQTIGSSAMPIKNGVKQTVHIQKPTQHNH